MTSVAHIYGKQHYLGGSEIRHGEHRGDTAKVHESPAEVDQAMKSSGDEMLEFRDFHNPGVSVFVDRRTIKAIKPIWIPEQTDKTLVRGD